MNNNRNIDLLESTEDSRKRKRDESSDDEGSVKQQKLTSSEEESSSEDGSQDNNSQKESSQMDNSQDEDYQGDESSSDNSSDDGSQLGVFVSGPSTSNTQQPVAGLSSSSTQHTVAGPSSNNIQQSVTNSSSINTQQPVADTFSINTQQPVADTSYNALPEFLNPNSINLSAMISIFPQQTIDQMRLVLTNYVDAVNSGNEQDINRRRFELRQYRDNWQDVLDAAQDRDPFLQETINTRNLRTGLQVYDRELTRIGAEAVASPVLGNPDEFISDSGMDDGGE